MLDTIIFGDCLEIMRDIPSGLIDMILCDLPYGLTQNKWDCHIPLDRLWEQYWRVLKGPGIIALTASQPFSSKLVACQEKFFRHEWIWIKNRGSNFANTVREPMKEHEHILIFSRGKWTYNKQMQERTGGGGGRVKYMFSNQTASSENYSRFTKPNANQGELRVPSSWQKFNTEVGLHPTQKPVKLGRYLIRTYTNPGDIVLDNACGSGTFPLAAMLEGRRFVGIENNQTYFEIARNRVGANDG